MGKKTQEALMLDLGTGKFSNQLCCKWVVSRILNATVIMLILLSITSCTTSKQVVSEQETEVEVKLPYDIDKVDPLLIAKLDEMTASNDPNKKDKYAVFINGRNNGGSMEASIYVSYITMRDHFKIPEENIIIFKDLTIHFKYFGVKKKALVVSDIYSSTPDNVFYFLNKMNEVFDKHDVLELGIYTDTPTDFRPSKPFISLLDEKGKREKLFLDNFISYFEDRDFLDFIKFENYMCFYGDAWAKEMSKLEKVVSFSSSSGSEIALGYHGAYFNEGFYLEKTDINKDGNHSFKEAFDYGIKESEKAEIKDGRDFSTPVIYYGSGISPDTTIEELFDIE